MAKLNLTLACNLYDRTFALQTGAVKPDGVDLNFLQMNVGEIFRRQARHAEFDVAEMSFSTYSILLGKGDRRMIAIPVFTSRKFRHSEIFVNTNSGIREPKDLVGKRMGSHEYQQTAAVWLRGQLEHDYGVPPDQIEWYFGGMNEPEDWQPRIPIDIPANYHTTTLSNRQCLNDMLESGEIHAAMGAGMPRSFLEGSPNVARLFPNYQDVESDYYKRTGIFPIMHTVVIKREIYEAAPWVAMSMYKAFVEAKAYGAFEMRRAPSTLFPSLPWLMVHMEETEALMGRDPFAYGVGEQNRRVIETLLQYNYEHGLIPKKITIEEFFAPETHSATFN